MDYLDVMFNDKRPFERKQVSGGTTGGRVTVTKQPVKVVPCLPECEANKIESDIRCIRKQVEESIKKSSQSNNNVNTSESICDDDVYKKYKFEQRSVSAMQLPVWASKSKILENIAEYPAVVIEGSTGCGKSTQVSFEEIVHVKPNMIVHAKSKHSSAMEIECSFHF